MPKDLWNILTSPEARKFQVAILSLLLSAASGGLLPPDIAIWVIMGINALAAAGVFVVPNSTTAVLAKPTEASDPKHKAPTQEIYRGDVRG